jgi:hypothetical protein
MPKPDNHAAHMRFRGRADADVVGEIGGRDRALVQGLSVLGLVAGLVAGP